MTESWPHTLMGRNKMVHRTELERARRGRVIQEVLKPELPWPRIGRNAQLLYMKVVDALDQLDAEDEASFNAAPEGLQSRALPGETILTDKELAEQAGYPVPDKKLPGYVYKHLPEANDAEQDDLRYLKGFVIGVLAATITIGVVNML